MLAIGHNQILTLLLAALIPMMLLPQGGSFCLCSPEECACAAAGNDDGTTTGLKTSCCCKKASANDRQALRSCCSKAGADKSKSPKTPCHKLEVPAAPSLDCTAELNFQLPELAIALQECLHQVQPRLVRAELEAPQTERHPPKRPRPAAANLPLQL